MKTLSCRPGCAACCIAPSITSPIPGMPKGKPAELPCVQLDENGLCKLFGKPERPTFCIGLQPSSDMCGESREDALQLITVMEKATQP